MEILTMLSYLIVILSAVILGVCVVIGYKRGTGRSLVRLIYLSVITVLTFFLSKALARMLAGTVISLVEPLYNDSLRKLIESSPEIKTLIANIVRAALVPFVFSLLFFIIQLLSLIKLKTISNKLINTVHKDGDPMNKASKWIGAGLGVLCGLIISTALIAPLSCAVEILQSVDQDVLKSFGLMGNDTKGEDSQKSSISTRYGSLAINFNYLSSNSQTYNGGFSFSGIFGEIISRSLTAIEGNSESLVEEAPKITNAAKEAMDAYQEQIEAGVSPEMAAISAMSSLVSNMGESEILTEITAEVLNSAATSFKNGDEFFGLSFDSSNEFTNTIVEAFIETLENTTPENVIENLTTLVGADTDSSEESVLGNLISLQSEGVSLKSEDSLDAMADALIEIGKNENMSQITDAMGQLGSDIIKEAGITTIPKDKDGAYEKIKEELVVTVNSSATMDYETRINSLAQTIVSTAASYNYTISLPQANLLAISLLAYFGSEENITVEGLMEYFGVTSADLPAS